MGGALPPSGQDVYKRQGEGCELNRVDHMHLTQAGHAQLAARVGAVLSLSLIHIYLRRLVHPLLDLLLGHFLQLQGEFHVLPHRHVGIQCVALEHHRDVPVFGLHVVDQLAVDVQLSLSLIHIYPVPGRPG